MWRLAVVMAWTLVLLLGGCGEYDGTGELCDRTEECDEGLLCVTEVLNCQGDDCWGTCERECNSADACEGGEICHSLGGVRVCRPADYQDPR